MNKKAELYEYRLPMNETLFKGMDQRKFDMGYKNPVWFSIKHDTAKQYGSYVHKFVTKKSFKLINISSPFFQSTFMDFLNDCYRKENNDHVAYRKKMELLVPIGLPDEKSQQTFLASSYSIQPYVKQTDKEHYKNVAFFYNRHRFSATDTDLYFVKFLQQIHLQYEFDGYIAPCIWPSKYHHKFSDEICLFKIDESKLSHISLEKIPQKGGRETYSNVRTFSPKTIEKLTMWSLEKLEMAGWDKKYELSNNGILIYPDAYTLQKFQEEKENRL